MARAFLPRLGWLAGLCLAILCGAAWASYIEEEFKGVQPPARPPEVRPPEIIRPLPPVPPARHVPELARYLDHLEVGRPVAYGRLTVYPLVLRGGETLGGRWLTMDAALGCGELVVTEKGGGNVPVIWMENRSRANHILIVAGEVVSGGKQTRTVRQDVILAPGQSVDVSVFCVEAHRWSGGAAFQSGGVMVPQSVQKSMRGGADQAGVWADVARANSALGAEAPTGSIEQGMNAPPVRRRLDEVRKAVLPQIPRDSVGFVFVDCYGGRAIGGEFFGNPALAMALFGKLLDAYAVDYVIQRRADSPPIAPAGAAEAFLDRIRRAGSFRAETPGSGAGIGMRAAGLVGEGVGLGDALVHFGCQDEVRMVPPPPAPPMPRPPRRYAPQGGAE